MATAYFEPGSLLRTLWEVEWGAGLVPVFFLAPLLYVAAREGKWPLRKTLRFAIPLALWAIPFATAQALAMWALHKRPPALAVTADGIWCAPWPETIRWENITGLGSYDEKLSHGWKSHGVSLNLSQPATSSSLLPAMYNSKPLRWGIWLARAAFLQKSSTAIPCGLTGLSLEASAANRLIQEIHFKLGPRTGAQYRRRNHCWVNHCLTTKGLDYVCIANMPSNPAASPCL